MNIENPLSPKQTKEHISTVLFALAGQGGCDGVPYDQMQIAATYILEVEARLRRLTEKTERACVCWRTNQNLMTANDWRELEAIVKEVKEALL